MNADRESGNLDFLRSFAVLSVVASHLMLLFQIAPWPLHRLGHWGVLIFFVHTSLVLMFSLERMKAANFGDLFAKFFTRRVFRIYPLSVLVVLIIWTLNLPVAHLAHGAFAGEPVNPQLLASNLLLTQDITNSDSMLAPLWSLPFEIQMYLFLPLLFLAAMYSKGVAPLVVIWMVAVLTAVLTPAIGDFWDYVPCFMGGIIAFKMSDKYKVKLPYYLWPVAIAVLSALYLLHLSNEQGWVVCLALGFFIPLFNEMPDGLVRRAAATIAKYSYGIYLAHFICLWFAFGYLHNVLPFWAQCMVFLVTFVVAPVALYHLVEHPFIVFGKWLTRSRTPRTAPAAAI
jgi:peptidoglycan/LPS O-acetylase OafA/YrhL